MQKVDSPALLCCIRGHYIWGNHHNSNKFPRIVPRRPTCTCLIDKIVIGLKVPKNVGTVNLLQSTV